MRSREERSLDVRATMGIWIALHVREYAGRIPTIGTAKVFRFTRQFCHNLEPERV